MKCLILNIAISISSGVGLLLTTAFSSNNLSPRIMHQSSSALNSHEDQKSTRRETIKSWTSAALAVGILVSSDEALAFPNKISSKYDDRPKQRGAVPKGLGVATRKDMAGEEYLGLKPCGAAPNCFCSTDSVEDDPDHSIPPWKYPNALNSETAFQELYEVIQAYPPGQSDIDGGGFSIVNFDPKKGYIYVQFESLKNGFIDDVEMAAINGGNVVQVRSSSRLGYLDFGVNAKRLNYLAKKLREKGWDAPGVELSSHQGYAEENQLKTL